jgi:AcrR family transcriptional regulator
MPTDTTKDRILAAAGPIFARKGFRNTTVREICDRAEVNLASVNYYFGDKQTLYTETLILAREMRAQQFPQQTWAENQPAEEKLRQYVTMLLNRVVAMQSEPWQVRLIMRELLQPTAAAQTLIDAYFRPVFESLLAIVDELAGNRLPDYQRHQIGFSIVGQCMHYRFSAELIGMMIPRTEFDDHYNIQQLADHITTFSVNAIRNARSSVQA